MFLSVESQAPCHFCCGNVHTKLFSHYQSVALPQPPDTAKVSRTWKVNVNVLQVTAMLKGATASISRRKKKERRTLILAEFFSIANHRIPPDLRSSMWHVTCFAACVVKG
jgi:hypothetical protein